MQPEQSKQIIARFFKAVDALIAAKVIRGRQTFCNLYNIDKRNYYVQMKDFDREYIKLNWLTYLVEDFGVNATWLLTGEGKEFSKEKAKNGKSLENVKIDSGN